MLKHADNTAKKNVDILTITSALRNYFDGPTKLCLDLNLVKFLDISFRYFNCPFHPSY